MTNRKDLKSALDNAVCDKDFEKLHIADRMHICSLYFKSLSFNEQNEKIIESNLTEKLTALIASGMSEMLMISYAATGNALIDIIYDACEQNLIDLYNDACADFRHDRIINRDDAAYENFINRTL